MIIGPLISAVLLIVALWVLQDRFEGVTLADIAHGFRQLTRIQIAAAIGLTIAYYAVTTGYDFLGFRYINHKLHYRSIAVASFLSYALSHNLGLSVITASSIRYRMHSSTGISFAQTAKVAAFCGATFWLGLLALSSVLFLLFPFSMTPMEIGLPVASVRPLGWIALAGLITYVTVCVWRRKPIHIGTFDIPPVPGTLLLGQLVIGCLDWILASAVIYALLPTTGHLPYTQFLQIFMIAQIAGAISQLPGGIGVFDTIVYALLPAEVPGSAVIGTLLIYRIIFYIIPLLFALALLGTHEAREHGKHFTRASGAT